MQSDTNFKDFWPSNVILPTFHTSVKRKKNNFNSCNYNFFLYSVSLVLFLLFSLCHNVSDIYPMIYEQIPHDVGKTRWQRDRIGQLVDRNTVYLSVKSKLI